MSATMAAPLNVTGAEIVVAVDVDQSGDDHAARAASMVAVLAPEALPVTVPLTVHSASPFALFTMS